MTNRTDQPCTSRLFLRWGSAVCDNRTPVHEHAQAASGLTWTDADAEQSAKDREAL